MFLSKEVYHDSDTGHKCRIGNTLCSLPTFFGKVVNECVEVDIRLTAVHDDCGIVWLAHAMSLHDERQRVKSFVLPPRG